MEISKRYIFLGLAVVILAAAGSAAYFYHGYTEARREVTEMKQNPQKAAQETTQELIAKVAQLIVLPGDETPTVATVSDLEKLKGQQFFANAQIGHKVLIYTKAKKAILYDPVEHKIVEVAPLNLGNTQASANNITP